LRRRGSASLPARDANRCFCAGWCGRSLKALDIRTRPACNAAFIDLAAHLPAAALAQLLLGIHPITATGWTQAAGNTRPAYAAETHASAHTENKSIDL
jgi:hypothetical protein